MNSAFKPILLALALIIPALPSTFAESVSTEALGENSPAPAGTPSTATMPSSDDWHKDPSDWDVRIYPIYAWLPIFGANVTLPDYPELPSVPGAGAGNYPAGSTSGSLNGAFMGGFRVQKSKWAAGASFLWAGLSGDRTTPKVHVGMDVIYAQAFAGREILPSLYLEGGVRRMALNINAKVGELPEVNRKPGIWDPLVGVTYDKRLGKKWNLTAHVDGGGFGVGSDLSIGAEVHADWRFAKHFGLAMGFGTLHFKITDTVSAVNQQKTLIVDQTMYGPIFGFGIYF